MAELGWSEIEPDYNYQVTMSGRGYNKTFFQKRIKQAYDNGKQDGFQEKDNLIKYLEGAIEYEKNGSLWSSKKRLKVYEEILERVKSGNYETNNNNIG